MSVFMRADKLSYHLRTRHRTSNTTYASLSDFFSQFSKGCTLSCCSCSKLFNETDNFYGHECQRPKNKAAKSNVELYSAPPPPVDNHILSSPTSHQSANFMLPQLRDVTIIPISKKGSRKSEAQESSQKRAPSLKIKLSVPKKSKKKSRAPPPEPPPPPPTEPEPEPVEEEMDTADVVPPLRLNGDSSMFDSDVSRNDGSDWVLSEPMSQPPLLEAVPEPEPEPEPVVSSAIIVDVFFKFQILELVANISNNIICWAGNINLKLREAIKIKIISVIIL